ncbi:unnamed protein product, partial [Phaeothamnion confervicola]
DSFSFGSSVVDAAGVVAFVTVVYTAVAARPRFLRLPSFPVALASAAFLAVKLAAVREDTGGGWRNAFLWAALALSLALYANAARWWTSAFLEDLEAVEGLLLREAAPNVSVRQTVVAGLGTLEVIGLSDDATTAAVSGGVLGYKPPLVLIHGYAAGNVFWSFNLEALSRDFRVYCVELYGCGRSTRGKFSAKTPEDAERVFVDALERWRIAADLPYFVLCGHSLGAMVAAAYAMSHPDRVLKLVLASPAGVGPVPEDFHLRPVGLARGMLRLAWRSGMTPMAPVRWAGPFGPRLVHWLLRKRLSWMPEGSDVSKLDVDALARYMHQNWALVSS